MLAAVNAVGYKLIAFRCFRRIPLFRIDTLVSDLRLFQPFARNIPPFSGNVRVRQLSALCAINIIRRKTFPVIVVPKPAVLFVLDRTAACLAPKCFYLVQLFIDLVVMQNNVMMQRTFFAYLGVIDIIGTISTLSAIFALKLQKLPDRFLFLADRSAVVLWVCKHDVEIAREEIAEQGVEQPFYSLANVVSLFLLRGRL